MLKPFIVILVFCFIYLCGLNSYAQERLNPDSAASPSENYAISYFNRVIGQQSTLYNGSEYERYLYHIKSTPNFIDAESWQQGSVRFNGYTYTNVPLKYDLFKNELVSRLYNNVSEYVFDSEHVRNFEIAGHRFKYISADTTTNCPASGFYEVLSTGRAEALARYVKTLQNAYDNNTIEPYFTKASVAYFVKKGKDFISVNSERSLLNALKDHKKELQQYIKSNNIKFRKQPAQAMALITTYYNHLNF